MLKTVRVIASFAPCEKNWLSRGSAPVRQRRRWQRQRHCDDSGDVATARATTVATAKATAAMATDSGGSDGDVESNDVGCLA